MYVWCCIWRRHSPFWKDHTMRHPFSCLSHAYVSLIPLSLSFLCLSQSFASYILMSHFHVFPIPMSVLNNPLSLGIFHHGSMDDIPMSLCFREPLWWAGYHSWKDVDIPFVVKFPWAALERPLSGLERAVWDGQRPKASQVGVSSWDAVSKSPIFHRGWACS